MSLTLLQRVARGDRDAVSACLAEFGSLVWSLARRREINGSDAEDATQEIFIDLWRHADRFDPEIGSEITFVTMIARRRLIDRLRKRGRSVPTTSLLADGGPVCHTLAESVDIADEVAMISARMREIRPEQRTVLEMAINRGMSQTEIASSLGMPLGTVKAHARRGLLRLRELVNAGSLETAHEGDV